MADKKLFSGGSLQQAILAAARHFQIDADDVAYEARTSRQGMVRGRTRIVIEVDPDAPRRPLGPAVVPAAQPAPTAQQVPVTRPVAQTRSEPPRPAYQAPRAAPAVAASSAPQVIAEGPQAEAVQAALEHLGRLAGLQLEARVLQGATGLALDISGPSQSTLTEDGAQLLQAVDHLLPRVARGLFGEAIAVTVDSGGLQERLFEALRVMAREAGERVRRSGVPEALPEMAPADRRIIHLTLADETDLATESLGGGVFKRVQVRPA